MKNLLKLKNWVLAFAGILALCASACAPREVLYPLARQDVPRLREFPADFKPPLSNETEEPVGGFGGGTDGLTRTPVIFVHGNTVSANFWLPARDYFKSQGWHDEEMWAPSYGWNSVRAFDSADLSVPTLERFVSAVQTYLSEKSGRPVRQVDIVAHSLGVTLVRQWMMQENAFHRVRNFVAACGANHGVWTARPDARGQNRTVAFELYPGSPWLKQLNRFGETPGATHYMTLYDGTGQNDALFPESTKESPRLEGAYNLAYDVRFNRYYDHLELPRVAETMEEIVGFLRRSAEPLPSATQPELMHLNDALRTTQADALVHCATGGAYPTLNNPGAEEMPLAADKLYTCFAHNERSGLSGPMARYKRVAGTRGQGPGKLEVTATPTGGAFEQPQKVTLSSNDPDAFIVYTTSGAIPTSGSPLYADPIFISGPVTLRAMAIAPDGRQSAPVDLSFDISLEKVDTARTLQKQFDSSVPENYRGERKKGS